MLYDSIDLKEWPLYTPNYKDSNITIDVYGYNYKLPLPPQNTDIINHDLPAKDQKFKTTLKAKNINFWDDDDKERYIHREHHRKNNGVWMYIKGKKYYIPPVMYYFMNYWPLKSGEETIFRVTDLHFFYMLDLCCRDPKCLGLIDFKCRQIGDTEKVLCFIYWYCTRFRNVKAAMQSITEEHIYKSFKRMVYAHTKMDWYMKPQNKGTDNPEGGFMFQYPSSLQSNKKNAAQQKIQGTSTFSEADMMYEYPSLDSEIMFASSDAYAYDGQTLNLWYLDEFGKMKNMDPIEALGVIAPMMESRILDKIIGKVIMTSTVEELKGGKTLEWSQQLWDDADPSVRMEDGTTGNGLYRIFRSALDRAPVDEWGFPKAKEEELKIKMKLKGYLDRRDIKGLIRYRRKNPITIEDVFTSAENESGFDIENLVAREIYLKNQKVKKEVRGNLKWKDGIRDSEVIWEPNPNGRWFISHHPTDHKFELNAKVDHILMNKPANIQHYCGGVDPYDQETNIENKLSLGGIVIRRKFDANFDGAKFDENGKPLNGGMEWETERVVLDYLYRWQNPDDFYEDVILSFVYFGTEFLFEKNKGAGLQTYITNRGYKLYIQDQPDFTRSKTAMGKELSGITATPNSVNQLFELLQTETCVYPNTIHHLRYLGQLKRTNWKNRGANDLSMAGGWAKVASLRAIPKRKTEEQRKGERHYTTNYV
jgi:hypothetical protein